MGCFAAGARRGTLAQRVEPSTRDTASSGVAAAAKLFALHCAFVALPAVSACVAGQFASGASCADCTASAPFSLSGALGREQCFDHAYAGPTDTVLSFYGTAAEVSLEYGATPGVTHTADAFGNPDAAVSLAGYASLVLPLEKSVPLPTGQAARTSSAWFRVTSASCGSTLGEQVVRWGVTEDSRLWSLAISGLQGFPYLWANNNDYDPSPSIFVCDDKWHHAAISIDGAGTLPPIMFIDGVQHTMKSAGEGDAGAPINTASNTSFLIGGAAVWGGYFTGAVFDVRVYGRALSTGEMLALSQPFLAFPNTSMTPLAQSAAATSYSFVCADGFVGKPTAVTKNVSDGTWTWAAGKPNCAPRPSSPSSSPSPQASAAQSSPQASVYFAAGGSGVILLALFSWLYFRRRAQNAGSTLYSLSDEEGVVDAPLYAPG